MANAGGISCWGYNFHGQLGDGTTTDRHVPTPVPGFAASALTAGVAHTCAVAATGGVWCWGYNGYGQLGDGTLLQRESPVPVTGF
jgi:alpha-tubulin suppressor-like RCC1 family protein